jgi:hypothetical protein
MFRPSATLAIVIGLFAQPSAAQPAATRTFGTWTASCNNLGACVVTAAAGDGGDLLYLRLARDAGASAPPHATIVLAVPDGAKGPFERFRLTAVDGGRKIGLAPVASEAAKDDPTRVSGDIAPGAATLALIEAIRNAATLDIASGSESGTLDLKGLSAALRFIDDRQGRVGGPTALVAKGMTPVGQVPDPTPPPIVVPAPAGSATAVVKPIVTPALLALATTTCDADVVRAHADLKAWRLAPDRILFAVPCQAGAYNFQSALYFTNALGKPTGPANLPQPAPGGDDAPNVITNGDFDATTMELSIFAKGRGIGDCGLVATWVWTGTGFALLTASGLDRCPGAFSEDWPNLYTAAKR